MKNNRVIVRCYTVPRGRNRRLTRMFTYRCPARSRTPIKDLQLRLFRNWNMHPLDTCVPVLDLWAPVGGPIYRFE
jgi:hypothetical protein